MRFAGPSRRTTTAYDRYLEPSIKGSTDVDWSDFEARRGFLAAIVADAEWLLV